MRHTVGFYHQSIKAIGHFAHFLPLLPHSTGQFGAYSLCGCDTLVARAPANPSSHSPPAHTRRPHEMVALGMRRYLTHKAVKCLLSVIEVSTESSMKVFCYKL